MKQKEFPSSGGVRGGLKVIIKDMQGILHIVVKRKIIPYKTQLKVLAKRLRKDITIIKILLRKN
jgi:hypothetical protein